ncbi:MAG: dihydroorotate dehydrogenase [Candidatus Omnitrophica bacterium]|jgi:dihydroorotate dehydrogenase (NAD+) catalytic subunit|nr:dihydroorotate dehydrogenase [Candidatus Omnitrophota bacterium]
MKVNLSVAIGKLMLKNPVMVASGTFGYAEEFSGFMDLRKLGAIVTKTITIAPRLGNPAPRTCETASGMINSIGLENPGADKFIKEKIPYLKKIGVPIIVSIASEKDPEEFVFLAKKLNNIPAVAALELNISCPNVHKNTQLVAQDAQVTYKVVKKVRAATRKTLITKLSPNVTDIVSIAKEAEDAGSDCLAMINTLQGMSIDINNFKPKIAMGSGGLSGPAIRPVAIKMVWDVYRKVKIPIIGMGGIIDTNSAIEFFLAGSTAVAVGTGNFIYPKLTIEIIRGIEAYLENKGTRNINGIKGKVLA